MKWFLGIAFIFLFSGCIGFSIDRSGGIVRYKDGEAYTAFGRFKTGALPKGWKNPKIRQKQLVYENDDLGATLLADALCGPKFVDAPLSRLAQDLFDRMEDRRFLKERNISLDHRAAYRITGTGRIDGVSLMMDAVVMKKDFCLYDLVYFAPPGSFAKGMSDFEGFLNGFKTR